MKESIQTVNFNKGLRPSLPEVRNTNFLTESKGAYPYEEVLRALDLFTQIDTSSLGTFSFPYPQVFVLQELMLICTPTAIYEFDGLNFTQQITSLTEGVRWRVVDYKTFLYLTNGAVCVTRDPISGAYTQRNDLPYGLSAGDFNGQLFVGSPLLTAGVPEIIVTVEGEPIGTVGGEEIGTVGTL